LSQRSRGASFGRKNVIFIDDVGMPEKETYGARPPIEMARQILDLKFVFEKKEKTKINI
jgi:dynein heavy chain